MLTKAETAFLFSSSVLPLWLAQNRCCRAEINRIKTLLCLGASPAAIWNVMGLGERRWFCERTGQPGHERDSWSSVEPFAADTISRWATAHIARELRLTGPLPQSFGKGSEARS